MLADPLFCVSREQHPEIPSFYYMFNRKYEEKKWITDVVQLGIWDYGNLIGTEE